MRACPARSGAPCTWRDLGAFVDRSGLVGAVRVEQCAHCGHARSLPPLADVAFLYEGRESQDFQPGAHGLAHAIKRLAFRRDAGRLLRQIGPAPSTLRDSGTLLDFGCGSGQFTRALGDRLGADRVTGSDFFADPPGELADRPYCPMERLADQAGQFDSVIAMHVLEHDDNVAALLARISAMARPGGTVVIEVPNVACVWARIFGKYWDAWYLPYHRTHFSRASLVAAVTAGGLEVRAVHGAVVPTMGRTFANLFGRRNTLFWLLLGVALHPLQLLGEKLTGQPSALRVIARRV